jgi:hypothetical protein
VWTAPSEIAFGLAGWQNDWLSGCEKGLKLGAQIAQYHRAFS